MAFLVDAWASLSLLCTLQIETLEGFSLALQPSS